jgi:hypothetical protein
MKKLLAVALFFIAISAEARSKDAYILCSDGESVSALISGDINWRDTGSLCHRYGGSSLWVRRDGREYVIRDRDFLARAGALFGPIRQLGPEQRRIAAEEAKLDAEADRLSDGEDDSPAVRERLRELNRKQREVAIREREIDRREEELEREAERALWRMVDRAITSGVAVRER